MAKSIKVINRKLGQERAFGLAHIDFSTIELDSRLKGYRHLLYLIHESLHIIHPEWSETKVVKVSRRLAKLIWSQKYRRIDS